MEQIYKQLAWAKTQDWYPLFQKCLLCMPELDWEVYSIIDTFDWSETEEGHSFWAKINEAVVDIAISTVDISTSRIRKIVFPKADFPEAYI